MQTRNQERTIKKRWSSYLTRRGALALFVAMLACTLCSCSAAQNSNQSQGDAAKSADKVPVVDMAGRELSLPAHPKKIIGIGSTLRSICYLQAQDSVVGVEAAEKQDMVGCVYRHVFHDKFANLPVIGEGGKNGIKPNEEAIADLAPEIIFSTLDKERAETLQQRTGVPVVCLTFARDLFDETFYKNLTLMGKILNKEKRAQEVIDYMKKAQSDLQERVKNVPSKTAFAAAISYRGAHGFAGTEAGFPPFAILKLKNIADINDKKGPYDIDLEKVSADQPDYIFVESNNFKMVEKDIQQNPGYFKNLKAVQNKQVFSLVSYRFYGTNTELAIANCYQVGHCAYPEAFGDIDPTKKLDEITSFFVGKPISADLAKIGCSFKKYDLAA